MVHGPWSMDYGPATNLSWCVLPSPEHRHPTCLLFRRGRELLRDQAWRGVDLDCEDLGSADGAVDRHLGRAAVHVHPRLAGLAEYESDSVGAVRLPPDRYAGDADQVLRYSSVSLARDLIRVDEVADQCPAAISPSRCIEP